MTFFMLSVWLLFVSLGKVYGIICKLSNPFKKPQEYYQIGDFIIGGVATQFYPFSETIDFRQYPNPWLFESPV